MIKQHGSNVIPLHPRLMAAKSREPLDEGVSRVFTYPPRLIDVTEATSHLTTILGSGVRSTALIELDAPPDLLIAHVDGGFELYDSASLRRTPFSASETELDLHWVRSWYFAVFERAGTILGRYLNNTSGLIELSYLEQPIFDPNHASTFSLDEFIQRVTFGD